jgi:hypothetical protein
MAVILRRAERRRSRRTDRSSGKEVHAGPTAGALRAINCGMRNAKYGITGGRAVQIGTGLRVLFAVLGLAALIPVALISANEFRAMSNGSRGGPLIMLAFCTAVALGAFTLLRASFRGAAFVRRPNRERSNG